MFSLSRSSPSFTGIQFPESIRPPDNDDPILRWNSCARLLMEHPQLHERTNEPNMPFTLE